MYEQELSLFIEIYRIAVRMISVPFLLAVLQISNHGFIIYVIRCNATFSRSRVLKRDTCSDFACGAGHRMCSKIELNMYTKVNRTVMVVG